MIIHSKCTILICVLKFNHWCGSLPTVHWNETITTIYNTVLMENQDPNRGQRKTIFTH